MPFIARLSWAAGRWHVAALVILAGIAGLAPPLAAWALAGLLDHLAHHESAHALALAWLLGAAGLAAAVATSLTHLLQREYNRRLVRQAKTRLFDRVSQVDTIETFEDPAFHDRLRMAQQSGTAVPQSITSSFSGTTQAAITCIGLIAVLAKTSPLALLALALVAVPTAGAALSASRERAKVLWGLSGRFRREMFYAGLLTESAAIKETRLLGIAGTLQARMRKEMSEIDRAEAVLDRKYLLRQGVMTWLAAVVLAVISFLAVRQSVVGRLSLGSVSLVIAASGGFAAATAGLIERVADIRQGLRMFAHFQELVDAPNEGRPQLDALPPLRKGIDAHSLSFTYPGASVAVLEDLNLQIPFGKTTAIVGLNGAGKSTLVKLLCGLYLPSAGSICWDGRDSRSFDVRSVRDRIGAVFQDFMQYDLSVRDNVGLGNVNKVDDASAVSDALTRSGAADLVGRLPRAADTMLSRTFFDDDADDGMMISGGEWQRLAIARAYMRIQHDVMILDEPSSGLDVEAEAQVHQDLRAARAGRTNVLISHRLSTVRGADRIYVLENGQVRESGTHASLLAAEGEYARLFRLQARGYVEAEPVMTGLVE